MRWVCLAFISLSLSACRCPTYVLSPRGAGKLYRRLTVGPDPVGVQHQPTSLLQGSPPTQVPCDPAGLWPPAPGGSRRKVGATAQPPISLHLLPPWLSQERARGRMPDLSRGLRTQGGRCDLCSADHLMCNVPWYLNHSPVRWGLIVSRLHTRKCA